MRRLVPLLFLVFVSLVWSQSPTPLAARDAQDLAALQKLASITTAQAQTKSADHAAQYQAALVQLYLAEVALEKKDKRTSGSAAESGIELAKRAVSLQPNNAEYHRLLGSLCGQVIPANVLMGLKYGKCALDEISRAVELDGKAALNFLSRGVGNYYLPPQFGGSVDKAVADFDKAISLDPKLADAHLWRGIALRKLGRNREARQAIEKSLTLNPRRLWTKEQLAKTPAQ